ncbi:F0F1 ATP synthase subunit gamma [Desulfuromonas acetoxidans]|uniref:F0F1 ATP synthase subunit gamma n=1 Tax=Desulfuromonas acetoxidans TaxID=891 RepID=UPI00292EA352|nr:F0F1 ATP synthase subunit gamma [Desulfuromonas acetoxidans]
MSDTLLGLQRKINSATDLAGVVRTMKALAASSISQYEEAVESLRHYGHTVDLGLSACLRALPANFKNNQQDPPLTLVLIFGSDQGLVGQFNESLVAFALKKLPRSKPRRLIAIGERIAGQLETHNHAADQVYRIPTSVDSITELGIDLQLDNADLSLTPQRHGMQVFYNAPHLGTTYVPRMRTILPLDLAWQEQLSRLDWPSSALPEICGRLDDTFIALLKEYLFISFFQACAESLASENICRLTAMQRAEKNIQDQLDSLQRTYHRRRQDTIDAELFDVTFGFEQLNHEGR